MTNFSKTRREIALLLEGARQGLDLGNPARGAAVGLTVVINSAARRVHSREQSRA